jgi:hypothetical protein
MRKVVKDLAGGEGIGGTYGTLREQDVSAIFKSMRLSHDSILLDVGHGIGLPLMHAAATEDVSVTWGWECDSVKFHKSVTFCDRVSAQFGLRPPVLSPFDAGKATTLGPTTHVYACWQGWDSDDQRALAQLFNASTDAKCIVVVQSLQKQGQRDVVAFMEGLGFNDLLPPSFHAKVKCTNTTLHAFTFFKKVRVRARIVAKGRSATPKIA